MAQVLRIVYKEVDVDAPEVAGEASHGERHIEHLVKEAIQGRVEAFGSLYEHYFNPLFRYAYYHLQNKMAAEDAVEEVFIKAWKAIQSCKGKEATFKAWIYRITHNHVMDILRTKKDTMPINEIELGIAANCVEEFEINEEYHSLLKHITELPPDQKQVIVLKFIEDMNNSEISKITGKSQGAIRILQMRALQKLKAMENGQ